MNELPVEKSWAETIGFDPIRSFGTLSVENCFKLNVWARTNEALPLISLPSDPDNPARKLPHCAHIDFKVLPVQMVPQGPLLLWLYYRGVPLPKSTKRVDIESQVLNAITINAGLDEQKIKIINQNGSTAESYVTVDPITLMSDTDWTDNGPAIVACIRDETKVPKIDATFLDSIFGVGINGVRLRAWLRYQSGHLDVRSLRMTYATLQIDGKPEEVTIFEMKVTPSMKNVVYVVHIVFNSKGGYVAKMSKCDCPNGWLFCSHSLAIFLVFYLIQRQDKWTFDDVVEFMPEPIKSLQNLPLATSFVFEELDVSAPGGKRGQKRKRDAKRVISKIAKLLASEVPGYTTDERYAFNEEDAQIEFDTHVRDRRDNSKDIKVVDLCQMVADQVEQYNGMPVNAAKVRTSMIEDKNREKVNRPMTDVGMLRKLLQHDRLHQMMRDNWIARDSALWPYLEHFKSDRQKKIEELEAKVAKTDRLRGGPRGDEYNKEFLNNYFK